MQIILDIGGSKYTVIIQNYSLVNSSQYSTIGKYNREEIVNILKEDVIDYIKTIIDIWGKTYSIRLLRGYDKVCIWNTDIDSIELLFYHTKNFIYCNCC